MKNDMIQNHPFSFLKSRNDNKFDSSVIEDWCKARTYVLEKLKDIVIGPKSTEILKVIVKIDKDHKALMLSVVRHLALFAHFSNYEECDEYGEIVSRNCSTIIIVSDEDDMDEELKKEQYLNNLLVYCKYKKYGESIVPKGISIPIDIDFRIVKSMPENDGDCMMISFEDVGNVLSTKSDAETYCIDTLLAERCRDVYGLGADIDKIPYEDIHDVSRFNQALNVFQYKYLSETPKPLINEEWNKNQTEVRNGLSNIFCSDRFRSIAAGIKKDATSADVEKSLWEDKKLAVSEHTRWLVEKLILGFRPLNDIERSRYETLLGDQRKAYAKNLKGKAIAPAHTNICSFKDLRRIDPDNRKYDSFLMLAIPKILEEVNE